MLCREIGRHTCRYLTGPQAKLCSSTSRTGCSLYPTPGTFGDGFGLHVQTQRLRTKEQRNIGTPSTQSGSCVGVHCHVHMLHSVHKRVFHLVDFQITGMLNAALCPRGGRQMSHLRAALARTIRSRICFVVGPKSQDALNFKHFALDELFDMGSETACLKILLLRCCPGDWRNEDGFEKILRPVETQERALKMLEDLLVPFPCRRPFWVYPRSRWVGADQSLLDLWASIHN